jgi:ribosome-binding protein aMBF1 (putative translation factor)
MKRKMPKPTTRKAASASGSPENKKFMPEQKRRWERAVAEETSPKALAEHRAAADRGALAIDASRDLLRDVVRLLRAERERQGLTAAEVAERCDMERSALCRLETVANANPTVAAVCGIAQALGKTLVVRLE